MMDENRKRKHKWIWVVLLILLVVAVGHGPVLSWGVTWAVEKFLPQTGMAVAYDRLGISAFRPIRIEGLKVSTVGLPDSETLVEADEVVVTMVSVDRLWNDQTRWVSALEIKNLRGTVDAREGGLPEFPPLPDLTEDEQLTVAKVALAILPESVAFGSGAFRVLTEDAEIRLDGVELGLSEEAAGELRVQELVIDAGKFTEVFRDRKAVTAWKGGILYLSDLAVREGLILRGMSLDLAVPGGVAATGDLEFLRGSMRLDSQIRFLEGEVFIDGALAVFDLALEPLPDLLGIDTTADGVIRDARVIFRGATDRLMDSSGSLRLQAGEIAWDERALDSVEIGANYVGRRLQVAQFELLQGENEITLNGEVAIPEKLEEIKASRFLVNLSANIRSLPTFASLVTGPIDGLRGRFSVHGSLNGEGGVVNGYLEAEASGLGIVDLPDASARVFAVAENGEVQVQHVSVGCGDDSVEAKGSIAMDAPHQYSGEASVRIEDLGRYLVVFGKNNEVENGNEPVAGAVDLRWEGDGTLTAHSGFFECDVKNLVSEYTAAGLTSRLSGTYSPHNVHFGTIELETGGLEFSAQATLSESGCNVSEASLRKGTLELLGGEAFVPFNVFALIEGKSADEALDLARPVYVDIASKDLAVSDLAQLVGQEPVLGGRVQLKIQANGPLPTMTGAVTFRGRDLVGMTDEVPLPQTGIDVDVLVGEGIAKLGGEIRARGLDPFRLSGEVPMAFEKSADGAITFFDKDDPLVARMDFPKTNLELLRLVVPDARRLLGSVSGYLGVGGTIGKPVFDGRIELTGGDIELSTELPPITGLNALVTLTPEEAKLVSLRGESGAGPFEATGSMMLGDLDDPVWKFSLRGEKVLLMRNPLVRLRADVEIDGAGSLEHAAVTGQIRLVDGRIYKQLEITPFLAPSPLDGELFVAPRLAGLVPPPVGNWTLDIGIENASPFLLVGNLATGEISPDLKLVGTFGNPTVTGTVKMENLRAFLPATTLDIPEGKIDFVADNPFMPILDIRATTRTSGYNIRMLAYGSLDDPQLAVRSDPPMSQENLIVFMTTGVAPVGMSGPGLGTVAVGQGSILLLRGLARQFEPLGLDLGSVVDRLSVSVSPQQDTRQADSLSAEFELTDRFSLAAGEDGFGFFNAGVQYTIRFR